MANVNTIEGRRALRTEGLTGNAAAIGFAMRDGRLASLEDVEEWCRDPVKVLNAFATITSITAKSMFESVRYQGFSKEQFMDSWTIEHGLSPTTMVKVAFVAAVRGTNVDKLREILTSEILAIPNAAALVTLLVTGAATIARPNTRLTPEGRKAITMSRCVAVVPHIVAAMLRIAEVPARYPDLGCPAWLQFPAAASLPLRDLRRTEHIEFNNLFSTAINAGRADVGSRQMTIYNQQVNTGLTPLKMPAWVAEQLVDDITTLSYVEATAIAAEE